MSSQKNRLEKAARDLQNILEEIEPYIKRPVVVEPTTIGRWTRGDSLEGDVSQSWKEEMAPSK